MGRLFLDIVQDNFLCQHVTQATRGTNILDLVISSEEDLVSKLRIGPSIGGSDHSSIDFILNLELPGRAQINLGLDYRKADIGAISKEIGEIDWNERFRKMDANEMWMEFVMVMEQLRDEYVPRFKGSRRRKQKWMDYRACRAVNKKYKAWKRYTDTPEYQSYVEFKRVRNKAAAELRRSKRAFEEKLAEGIKKDSKSFFRYVRSKSGAKDKIGPLKDNDGNLLTSNEDMSELLNRFFASVFTQELGVVDGSFEGNDGEQLSGSMSSGNGILITEAMVTDQIGRLADNKAAGTDGLGSSFIKQLIGVVELPLVLIFQESLRTGQVPVQWKEANVTAIFKRKGLRCEPGNYRPVSLTSQIGRIFERIVRDHLVKFLEDNDLLKDSQHGFRSKRSCLTDLLEFLGSGFRLCRSRYTCGCYLLRLSESV